MDDASRKIEIRTLSPEDLAAVEEHLKNEFKPASIDARIEEMFGGPPWLAGKMAAVGREIRENPESCFVAVKEGRVVGFITNVINRIASRGTVANIAVSSACRGEGIGRKLILHSLDHFRKLGLHNAKIETLACNEAGQHLYTSIGFKEVVRQIHYAMKI